MFIPGTFAVSQHDVCERLLAVPADPSSEAPEAAEHAAGLSHTCCMKQILPVAAVWKPAGMPSHTDTHSWHFLPAATGKRHTPPMQGPNALPVMLLKVLRLFYTFRIKPLWNCRTSGTQSENRPADKTRRIKLAVLSSLEIGRFDSLLCEERDCFHHTYRTRNRRRLTEVSRLIYHQAATT